MLARCVAVLLRLLAATWRVSRPAWPVEGPCVLAFWHGEQLPLVLTHRGMGITGMVSRSRDGARLAAVLAALGFPVIRGSTSRGGWQAMRAAVRTLGEGGRVGLAVDGPRGPAGRVQPGAEALAARTGSPIVFGTVQAHGWRASSWDHFLVPWPFARVEVRYVVTPAGEPLRRPSAS